jgi:homopolymeric O-antigen transport system permease protein
MTERVREVPTVVIEPVIGWANLGLGELWDYHELLYFLTWREIKIRYKQTAIGAAWALLQPLLQVAVFTLIFGRLAHLPSDGLDYSLFNFGGLVPFMFFQSGLTQASNSLVLNANLISKIYFPRLAMPIASVLSGTVDLALALLLLVGFAAFKHVAFSARLLWVPAFLLLALITSLGAGLWLSALNVEYRDVRYVVPFLNQFWMFATPVVYSSNMFPERWRPLLGLNPMVGAVDGFRWALLGANTEPGAALAVSAAIAVTLLISGAFYFRRMESSFADVV